MEKSNRRSGNTFYMSSKLYFHISNAEKYFCRIALEIKAWRGSISQLSFFTPSGDYIETWTGAIPKEYFMQYIKDSIDKVPILRPGIPQGLKFQWPSFVQRELKAKFKKSFPSDLELDTFFSSCNYKKFVDFNVCKFYPRSIPDSLASQMFEDQK